MIRKEDFDCFMFYVGKSKLIRNLFILFFLNFFLFIDCTFWLYIRKHINDINYNTHKLPIQKINKLCINPATNI